jgi:hypothetical protein
MELILIHKYVKAQSVLHSVVEILATFPGDMRSRLDDAFSELDSIVDTDLPEELRDDWSFAMQKLKKHGPKFDCNGRVCIGSVKNTMSKIRNTAASKIADKLYKIFYELNCSGKYA